VANPDSAAFYASPFWLTLRARCFARDRYTCVVDGCRARATHCDHIKRRPHARQPTPLDILDNLRSLCAQHDAQVKETRGGQRRGKGAFKVTGSDVNGWPRDPKRR
jgi:hypothetical protein